MCAAFNWNKIPKIIPSPVFSMLYVIDLVILPPAGWRGTAAAMPLSDEVTPLSCA